MVKNLINIFCNLLECTHDPCDKTHCPHGKVCKADLKKCTAECVCGPPDCKHDCGKYGKCVQDPYTCKSKCSK